MWLCYCFLMIYLNCLFDLLFPCSIQQLDLFTALHYLLVTNIDKLLKQMCIAVLTNNALQCALQYVNTN